MCGSTAVTFGTSLLRQQRGACAGSAEPTSQNVHANRDTFAEVLNIDPAKLDHIAPDVGGGFGAKNSGYPEPPLCLYAAKRLGRPVKWINSRSESFLSDTHGRGQSSRVKKPDPTKTDKAKAPTPRYAASALDAIEATASARSQRRTGPRFAGSTRA